MTVHRVMHFTAVCQNAQLLSKLMTITKLHHAAWCAGNVLEVGSLEDLRAAGKGGLDPNGGPCTVTRTVMKMATLKFCMNDPWVCDDPCMPTDISNYAVSQKRSSRLIQASLLPAQLQVRPGRKHAHSCSSEGFPPGVTFPASIAAGMQPYLSMQMERSQHLT